MSLSTQAKLVSKLLHDLIAPASSLLNGMELLESAKIDPEIYDFMKEGATALNEKLKMFRLVYGASGDPSLNELKAFCHRVNGFLAIYEGVCLQSGDNIAIDAQDIKILGGLLVTVSHIATSPFEVHLKGAAAGVDIRITGLKLALKDETVHALTHDIGDPDADVSVYVVQPWLVAQQAKSCQRNLEVIVNKIGEIHILYAK